MSYTWTEKHRNTALERQLTPSARELYEYLVLEGYEGKPQVLDLREFNKFIAKRRGQPYDRRTIKKARDFLEEKGLLTACKQFTAFVHHVTLRAVSALFKPKKGGDIGCKSRSLDATLDPSNASNAAVGVHTTTTNSSFTEADLLQAAPLTEASYLEQNLTMCEEAGIEFSEGSTHVVKILSSRHPEEVMEVVDYCVEYASRNNVPSMAGLFLDALRKGYWKKNRKRLTLFDGLLSLCILHGTLPK